MIPLDTKPGTTIWVFSTLAPENEVYRGSLSYVHSDGRQVVVSVPRSETAEQFTCHILDQPATFLTEAEATAVCAAWLLKEGERLNAMLHENEKKLWVVKQRIHELKSGAKERDPR